MPSFPLFLSIVIVVFVSLAMLLDSPLRKLRRKRTETAKQDRICSRTKNRLANHYQRNSGLLGNWYDSRQFYCHLNKLLSHYEAFKAKNDPSITPDQFLLRQARSLRQLLDRRIIAAELEQFAIQNSCDVPADELDQFLLDVTDHNRPFADSVDLALSIRRKLRKAIPKNLPATVKSHNSILDAYQEERARQEEELKKVISPSVGGLSQLNVELDRHMNEWMYQHAGGN